MPKRFQNGLDYNVGGFEFIWNLLEAVPLPSSPRNDLVFAYLAIMLEHQHAIATLIKANLVGSAAALLRPQLETGLRCLWVNLIATDGQVTDIAQYGKEPFPKFKTMVADLDFAYGANGWIASFANQWAALNGMTHSGLEQLGRRFASAGHIAPNYPDEFTSELATFSGTISIGCLVPVFRQIGLNDKATALEEWLNANSQHPYPSPDPSGDSG